jgi:uncharacterized protein
MDQAITPGADRAGDWMITYTGQRFWPLDPREDEIDFRDIGHALSMICRYNGHTRRFYSVAEHSVLLSLLFEQTSRNLELARYALLHDGSEAYLGDIIRPLKKFTPFYLGHEARLQALIYRKAGLDIEAPAPVLDADARIIVNEATELFSDETRRAAGWNFAKDNGLPRIAIDGLPPHKAERLWATSFARLFPAVPF